MATSTHFAPQLFIKSGVRNIDFYKTALGAVERIRWASDDGNIHVAEFAIGETLFHLHEESPEKGLLAPDKGTTVTIGLFVEDVDRVMRDAETAGAIITSQAQDYEYGYRQGQFRDPFGHIWLIQKKI